MKYIDVSTWKRAMHCDVFRNSVQPQYCVTFDVDITNFLSQVKKRRFSFTFSFVYAVTKCANEIEEFRCQFVEGKPAVFETINTSFTYLDKSTELFKVVNVPMQDTMEDYVALAKKQRKIRQTISPRQWQMIFISFLLFRGYHTLIFPILNREKKIMPLLCLTGESSMKKTEKSIYLSPYKYIIHLLTAYILGNLQRNCSAI